MSAAQSSMPSERMLTTTELGNLMGVHRKTAYRWAMKGYIRSWRAPGERTNYRIPYSAYVEFLNKFMTLPHDEQERLKAEGDDSSDDDVTGE